MMIKPGISDLSKCVDSRYTLVTMAAKRADDLVKNVCTIWTHTAMKNLYQLRQRKS